MTFPRRLFFLPPLSRPTSDNWNIYIYIYFFDASEEDEEGERKVSLVRLSGRILRDFFYLLFLLEEKISSVTGRKEGRKGTIEVCCFFFSINTGEQGDIVSVSLRFLYPD